VNHNDPDVFSHSKCEQWVRFPFLFVTLVLYFVVERKRKNRMKKAGALAETGENYESLVRMCVFKPPPSPSVSCLA
jgi:hypothetical protein